MKNIVFLLVLSLVSYCYCCTGCVGLDELTFEKVVKKFKSVLLKIDQQFPFGDTHEAWSTFANELSNKTVSGTDHSDLLIATVGVKDYGEEDNKALGEKYGLKKRQDGAVIKLFIDGDLENPISFDIGTEKVTTTQLYTFLKANANVYVFAPGCSKELDVLAEKFVREKNKRKEILREAEEFIEKHEDEEKQKLFKTYVALMKGIIEKGEDHVAKQNERMTNLLKGKLSEKKIDEINKKLNILGSFRFPIKTNKQEL